MDLGRLAITLPVPFATAGECVELAVRAEKEWGYDAFVPGMQVADLQGADFIGFDGPPIIEAAPGADVTIPIFVSHFSEREEPPTLKAWLKGANDLGGDIELFAKPRIVDWRPYDVVAQRPIEVEVPEIRNYVGAIGMELVDAGGERIAANFVNIVVRTETEDGAGPRAEKIDPRRLALRVSPTAYSAVSWKGERPRAFQREGKFFGTGSGVVEYRFDVKRGAHDAKAARSGRHFDAGPAVLVVEPQLFETTTPPGAGHHDVVTIRRPFRRKNIFPLRFGQRIGVAAIRVGNP